MAWDETAYLASLIKSGGGAVGPNAPMFGSDGASGIPPADASGFTATGGYDGVVDLRIKLKDAVYIDGTGDGSWAYCTTGGVKIIRKQSTAPIGYDDGTLVVDIPIRKLRNAVSASLTHTFTFQDTGLTNNVTYYYSAFPYSDHGVINYRNATIVSAKPIPKPQYKIWAFDQDFSNLDPATTITYPTSCNNYGYTPMMTNAGNGTPTLGSWKSFLEDELQNYPYVIDTTTGKAIKRLHPTDRLKYYDGTDIDPKSGYSHYAWIKKLYMHEEYSSDGNSREVQFSNSEVDGFYPVGFLTHATGTATYGSNINGIWIPIYPLTAMPSANGFYHNDKANVMPIVTWGTSTMESEKNVPNSRYQLTYILGAENIPFQLSGFTMTNSSNLLRDSKLTLSLSYLMRKENQPTVLNGSNNIASYHWTGIHNYLRDLLFMMGKTTNIKKSFGKGTSFYRNGYNWNQTLIANPRTELSSPNMLNGFIGSNDEMRGYEANKSAIMLHDSLFYSQVLTAYAYAILDESSRYYSSTMHDKSEFYCNALSSRASNGGIVISPFSSLAGHTNKMRKINNYVGSIPIRDAQTENTISAGICANNKYSDATFSYLPSGSSSPSFARISGDRLLFIDYTDTSTGEEQTFSNMNVCFPANESAGNTPQGTPTTTTKSYKFALYAPLFIPPANYSPDI